jgi:hypothetical protein
VSGIYTILVREKLTYIVNRLSQMILDKVFHGVLDQGRGCLLVFDEPKADVSFSYDFSTLVIPISPNSEHVWSCDRYARTGW